MHPVRLCCFSAAIQRQQASVGWCNTLTSIFADIPTLNLRSGKQLRHDCLGFAIPVDRDTLYLQTEFESAHRKNTKSTNMALTEINRLILI
jgi:hypothetical protein